MSKTTKALTNLFSFLKRLDLYGYPVEMRINGQKRSRSRCSGFVSVFVSVLIIYLLINNIKQWQNGKNFKIIPSTISYSISSMLLENKSFSYELNHSNFEIYFTMIATFPNGAHYNWSSLSRYFTQKLIYVNSQSIPQEIGFEPCSLKNRLNFLLEPFDLETDQLSPWNICLNQSIMMGLFADPLRSQVNGTGLQYHIYKCQNSSMNGNFCASDQEIGEMARGINIYINQPEVEFDFINADNPRTRQYNTLHYFMDFQLQKTVFSSIVKTELDSDYGIFNENYQLDSIDFNSKNNNMEIGLRRSDDNLLFQYSLGYDKTTQTFKRSSEKLYSLFGSVGGFANFIFIFGKLFGFFYNQRVFMRQLMNISYTIPPQKEISQITSPKSKKRISSWKSLLCLKKKINGNFFQKIHKYIDIKYIIKRLQDTEKLKALILDENQKKMLKSMPKPPFLKKCKTKDTHFSLIIDPNKCKQPNNINITESEQKHLSTEIRFPEIPNEEDKHQRPYSQSARNLNSYLFLTKSVPFQGKKN